MEYLMKKNSKFYKIIITKIKRLFERILLDMTMTEWDPELQEDQKKN